MAFPGSLEAEEGVDEGFAALSKQLVRPQRDLSPASLETVLEQVEMEVSPQGSNTLKNLSQRPSMEGF